jgi:ATP-dependent RNA helicase DDX21
MLRTASARALALTGKRSTQVLRALVARALTANTVVESHNAVRAYTQHKAWLESLAHQQCTGGGGSRGFASRASSRLEDQYDDSEDYDADELLDEQLADDDDDDDDFEQVQGSGPQVGKQLEEFGISQKLCDSLRAAGITALFPVQSECYELVMSGQDMTCKSRTGSGKTLAFAIPIVEALERDNAAAGDNDYDLRRRGRPTGRKPRAVVVAPTRELAKQVQREFERIAPDLVSLAVYGGAPIQAQQQSLRRGVDIVVGTPGRIIDHLESGTMDMSTVKFAVLDEADQMLQMGFADDVEKIFGFLPPREQRQTMLWSATMPGWVHKIGKKFLDRPKFIDLVGADDVKIPTTIDHWSVACTRDTRAEILSQMCSMYGRGKRILVFTRTKAEVDELAMLPGLAAMGAEPLHGGLAQQARERTLEVSKTEHLLISVISILCSVVYCDAAVCSASSQLSSVMSSL